MSIKNQICNILYTYVDIINNYVGAKRFIKNSSWYVLDNGSKFLELSYLIVISVGKIFISLLLFVFFFMPVYFNKL